MEKNPLLNSETFGQSAWLGYRSGSAMENGRFRKAISQNRILRGARKVIEQLIPVLPEIHATSSKETVKK